MQREQQATVFATDTDATCAHCGLPVPAAGGAPARFCCQGCAAVHALLTEHGLTRFYDLGGGKGCPVGAPPVPQRRDWLAELEHDLGDGRTRLVLDVQGIHCAACVFVLQELWRRHDGALQIRINPAIGQAELCYRRDRMALARFLDTVERLGYRVAPPRKQAAAADRGLLVRTGVCVALAMNAMMFASTEYFGLREGPAFDLFRGVSFALATVAVMVGGPVFFRAAWAGLRRRVLHLDLPIALGIAVAWSGSTVTHLSGSGEPYFDTVTIFVALMLVGRYLQQRAIQRNRDYLLADDGLEHVRVRRVRRGALELVPAQAIAPGDVLLLTPGDLLPVRARLLEGHAAFSLDWINGESEPRAFAAGDVVPAGSFQAGRRPVRVEAAADVHGSGLLALLARTGVERDDLRAHGRFWQWWNRLYVAAVLTIAAAAGAAWTFIDPSRAVAVTVAILVVTCPCAIGIATPLAFDLATAALRRRGVLVCSSGLLAKARHVRKVVLDKTGTVTWGRLRVTVVQPPPPELRGVLLAMAAGSNHPVSRAIVAALAKPGAVPLPIDGDLDEVPGAGIALRTDAATYRLGSPRFCRGAAGPAGRGACEFTEDGVVRARFLVHEDLRAGFADEVARLQAAGYEVHLLSGDHQAKVDAIARELGIDPVRARGGMSPRDKAAYVARLDADDTLMFGDGLNDAPAFEAAFVAGTPALDSPVLPARADFCSAGGRPDAVRAVLEYGTRFSSVVSTTLRLGLLYNAGAVALGVTGHMTPVLCAVLMPLGSLALIAHVTLRLRGVREER